MKTSFLIILIVLSISCYAECTLDMEAITAKQQKCGDECFKINDLIERSNCVNDCNGEWMRAQDEYYACRKLEEESKYTDAPEKKVKSHQGLVEFIRNGKTSTVTSNLEISAGDIIKTGNDGIVMLESEYATVKLFENTEAGFIKLDFNVPKITFPEEVPWDLDPNYQNERDDIGFWKKLFEDIVDFNLQNPPKYLVSCATGNYQKCPTGIITYITSGAMWFNKKIQTDFPKSGMVMTPTAAINTVGTRFIVLVDPDGTTTVTNIEGTVLVTSIATRKSATLDVNHKITVTKTGLGEVKHMTEPTEQQTEQTTTTQKGLTQPQMIMIAISIFVVAIALGIAIQVKRKKH